MERLSEIPGRIVLLGVLEFDVELDVLDLDVKSGVLDPFVQ